MTIERKKQQQRTEERFVSALRDMVTEIHIATESIGARGDSSVLFEEVPFEAGPQHCFVAATLD